MKNILRPFAGLATNFKNNTFLKTKIKLTLYYSIILFIIVIIFSIFIYIFFINYISADLKADPEISEVQETKMLEMATTRLRTILIFSDTGVLIIITALGYFLAGKTLKPIEKAMKDQKRFVSDSAHELRTPLSIMKIGIDAVTSDKRQVLEEYRKLADDLSEEVDKLIYLSEDLMFLAQSDSGKIENRLSTIDICSICKKQVRLIKPYANKNGISIKDYTEKPCYIRGEENQIKRLIVNLLKNAIDYNKNGGKVSVAIKDVRGIINLMVSDTGIGITQDDLKHIYERFYKIDKSRSGHKSGSGLGLSIVKEIVENHKGTISISSKPEKGTVVIVRFKSLKIT